jgi:mitochondrial fission protein ELM1
MTDGKAGMDSQCLGLAELLGLEPEMKVVSPRPPWSFLPPQLWLFPFSAQSSQDSGISPPWPSILIATGRQTVALSIAIKKASMGSTKTIQIQNPQCSISKFDLVLAPAHDQLSGENVISTIGALHRVNPDRLSLARRRFTKFYSSLPRPLIAVLIGGSNRRLRMDTTDAARLGEQLVSGVKHSGSGLLITASRRTDPKVISSLKNALGDVQYSFWDGQGDNPYFGMLALADGFVVTKDSINMVSEAAATGKPVHIFELNGKSKKFDLFHQGMRDARITRPFLGKFEKWQYDQPNDFKKIAIEIRKRVGID